MNSERRWCAQCRCVEVHEYVIRYNFGDQRLGVAWEGWVCRGRHS